MGNKPNPLLLKLEAKYEAEHQVRVRQHIEIDRMAMLIAAHRKLQVGPGRADGLLEEHTKVKSEIAKMIRDDVGDTHKRKDGNGDPEFLQTKRNLAVTLKSILGPEAWERDKYYFPMVKDYWDV